MSIQNNSWAISDTHFGHDNVIIYDKRPFKTGEEMDEAMIKNWNSVVKPNDIIYHLGDFAFLHESMICKILDRLNGNKILITGNHDKQMRKDCVRKYFKIITPYLEVYQNKQLICMFHYPQARWNKSHRGSFHIHGHCVDLDTEILTTNGWKFRKELSIEDKVYTVNNQNLSLNISQINSILDTMYSGNVIEFNGKSVDFRVTDLHRVVGISSHNSHYREVFAKDLEPITNLSFIKSVANNNKGVALTDELIRLYVYCTADGSLKKETNLWRIKVKKLHKKIEIRRCLSAIGLEYKELTYPDNDYSSFNFYMPSELLFYNPKGLDSKLLQMSCDQFKIFIDAYSLSDGSKNGNGILLSTAKKDECDLICHMSTINGYSCTVLTRIGHGFSLSPQYQLSIFPMLTNRIGTFKNRIKYSTVKNEHFWCIQVDNSNFFIRRNGKIHLTGNCHGNYTYPEECRAMDVGAPCIDYTPINLNKVIERLIKFPPTKHH